MEYELRSTNRRIKTNLRHAQTFLDTGPTAPNTGPKTSQWAKLRPSAWRGSLRQVGRTSLRASLPRHWRSRRQSLRWRIIVPFAVQIITIVVVIGGLSYYNGTQAVDGLARRLQEEIENRVRERTEAFLDQARTVNQLNQDLVELGLLDLQNQTALEEYFRKQIRRFQGLTAIYFGSESGMFAGSALNRREEVIIIQPEADYDPRQRPWYQQAIQANRPTWSEVYPVSKGERVDLVITAMSPILNEQQAVQGVLAVDFKLNRELGQFLEDLDVIDQGVTFLMDAQGNLVANSTGEAPFLLPHGPLAPGENPAPQQIAAVDSTNPTIATAAHYLRDQTDRLHPTTGNRNSITETFRQGSQTYFLRVAHLRDQWDLNWKIVVVIPAAKIRAEVERSAQQTMIACAVALLIAGVTGLWMTRSIVRPVRRLQRAARAMANGDLDRRVTLDRQDEVGELATFFNRMAQQLAESFEQLRSENLRMNAELAVSQRLQQMLLPTSAELAAIADLDIAGFMEPAAEVGGDYYDVLPLAQGGVWIAIGDVTGHGLESGVLATMVQTSVRTLLEAGETDFARLLPVLNQTIYKNVQRMGCDKNLTFCALIYDHGQLHISGQHEEILVMRQGGHLERLDTIDLGFPIGLDSDIEPFLGQTQTTLQVGEGVVLYSDGITEAVGPADPDASADTEAIYGLDRLCATIHQHWDQDATTICQRAIADLKAFTGDRPPADDITLLVVKRLPAPTGDRDPQVPSPPAS